MKELVNMECGRNEGGNNLNVSQDETVKFIDSNLRFQDNMFMFSNKSLNKFVVCTYVEVCS